MSKEYLGNWPRNLLIEIPKGQEIFNLLVWKLEDPNNFLKDKETTSLIHPLRGVTQITATRRGRRVEFRADLVNGIAIVALKPPQRADLLPKFALAYALGTPRRILQQVLETGGTNLVFPNPLGFQKNVEGARGTQDPVHCDFVTLKKWGENEILASYSSIDRSLTVPQIEELARRKPIAIVKPDPEHIRSMSR